jgi:hypothetical protein
VGDEAGPPIALSRAHDLELIVDNRGQGASRCAESLAEQNQPQELPRTEHWRASIALLPPALGHVQVAYCYGDFRNDGTMDVRLRFECADAETAKAAFFHLSALRDAFRLEALDRGLRVDGDWDLENDTVTANLVVEGVDGLLRQWLRAVLA